MTCERCWRDATLRAHAIGGDVDEHYRALLEERADDPCTAEEAAGEYWDPVTQRDTREWGSDHD